MINVEGISKKFEDFTALDDVTCNISDGCIYGMVGSNGAGKSTFLRVLSGVYRADKGYVFIDGANVYENPYVKENLVFVADELFFLPGTNMKKMADYYNSIYDKFDYERFNHLTEVFRLDPKKSINNFSKGMKRQVAIILALSSRAKYMFFDETFDGLDPVMRNLVKKLICNDVALYNVTAIITSHSLRELEDICDHLALLHKGGMVLDSDIIDLKTSQFKVQIAFNDSFDEGRFQDLKITRYRQEGSVASMIVGGDKEKTVSLLKSMNPVILDILPLTLEEVFTYEMEALGYKFDNVLESEADE
jgi:ABC-2 type transport system ATP-binding protein